MRRTSAALILALSIGLANVALPGNASDDEPRRPVAIALDWVRSHTGALSVSRADVARLRVTDAYVSSHTGVSHVYLRQTIAGLDVLGSSITVNVLPSGRVLHTGSRLVPNLDEATGRVVLTANEAATAAARALEVAPADITRVSPAKLAYQVLDDGRIRLAWNLDVEERSGLHWWNASVDAATGKLLARYDLVDHDNAQDIMAATDRTGPRARGSVVRRTSPEPVPDGSSYRVYALPLESPNDGDRTLVNTPADELASPFGWHDTNGATGPEYTQTRGNNVHAYLDTASTGSFGVPLPGTDAEGTSGLDFDYPVVHEAPPTANAYAAVTNLFYWNNIIHDVFYRYGFDEASGNFQVNNYDRGGLGNDYVQAEAQDGSGTNNANFATPVDGQRPRMQMYVWTTGAGSGRIIDGDFDAGVITHEYGHGISNRLTGGPGVGGCLSSHDERQGEGWSDWLALALTALPTENGEQARGMGTYVLNQSSRRGDGIRITPYSTDLSVNPSTYNRIKTAAEPHGVGYVWATMLWETYWDLVDKHGFNPDPYGDWTTGGNNLAIQLVMDGMKLQPCRPGFADARDAVLAADVALTGGENQCLIWRGFAKRGLGYSAQQNNPASKTDGVEAFDTHPDCRSTAVASPESISVTVSPGGSGSAALTVGNGALVDGESLSWAIAEAESSCSAPSNLAWLSADPASGTTPAAGGSEVAVSFDGGGLASGGSRSGLLCIASNDAETPVLAVPVDLTAS